MVLVFEAKLEVVVEFVGLLEGDVVVKFVGFVGIEGPKRRKSISWRSLVVELEERQLLLVVAPVEETRRL